MKVAFYWILAVFITFAAIIYQRKTGPTYDKKVSVVIDSQEYRFKLVRSHGGTTDCKIDLSIPDTQISGTLFFKQFPTNNPWIEVNMLRDDEKLSAALPNLPPAGKYEYKITLKNGDQTFALNEGEPVLIRFKGEVPAIVLIPHINFYVFCHVSW